MTYPSPTVEVSRRLFLVVSIVVASWLWWLTDLRPYVYVSRPPSPETRGPEAEPTLTVAGPAWESFFSRVDQSFVTNLPVPGWEHRITSADLKAARKENARRAAMTESQRRDERESVQRVREKYGVDAAFAGSFRLLYFQRDEPPFDTLPADDGTYVLALAGKPEPRLEVTLLPAHELIPFFDANPLPESFVHPFRKWSPWALAIGLALFLFLPYPRRPANVVAYRRWRILLGDLFSVLLFGTGFALPLAIVGGSVEAVSGILLVIPFWFLAGLGLLAFFWTAHGAVYCLVMREGAFDIRTLRGREEFAYADIREIEGALLMPPKWLVVASFIAALLGSSGTARMGQTGRALMLAGSAANGMRVTRKDGRSRFVWVSDQMGNAAMEHIDALVAGLTKAGVPIRDTVVTVRAMFPPQG